MQKQVSIVTGSPKPEDYVIADTLQEAIDQAWATRRHIHQLAPGRGSVIPRYAICFGNCLETAVKETTHA